MSGAQASIHGVDFTSAPRRAKPITVASGHLTEGAFHLERIDALPAFGEFERWLARPGPWLVRVPSDRAAHVRVHAALNAAVTAALENAR